MGISEASKAFLFRWIGQTDARVGFCQGFRDGWGIPNHRREPWWDDSLGSELGCLAGS